MTGGGMIKDRPLSHLREDLSL